MPLDTAPRPGFFSKFGQGLSNYGQQGVGNQMMGGNYGQLGSVLNNYLNRRRQMGQNPSGMTQPYGMPSPGMGGMGGMLGNPSGMGTPSFMQPPSMNSGGMTPSFMSGNTGSVGLPPPNLGPAGGMISSPDMNTGISQLWQRYRQQPGMMT